MPGNQINISGGITAYQGLLIRAGCLSGITLNVPLELECVGDDGAIRIGVTQNLNEDYTLASIVPTAAPRFNTYIATSDATAKQKENADYILTGTGDVATINAALAALPATGGDVYVSAGGTITQTSMIRIMGNYQRLIGYGVTVNSGTALSTNGAPFVSVGRNVGSNFTCARDSGTSILTFTFSEAYVLGNGEQGYICTFSGSTLPSGLDSVTRYYIINLTETPSGSSTFQLATTANGSSITAASAGSGTLFLAYEPATYNSTSNVWTLTGTSPRTFADGTIISVENRGGALPAGDSTHTGFQKAPLEIYYSKNVGTNQYTLYFDYGLTNAANGASAGTGLHTFTPTSVESTILGFDFNVTVDFGVAKFPRASFRSTMEATKMRAATGISTKAAIGNIGGYNTRILNCLVEGFGGDGLTFPGTGNTNALVRDCIIRGNKGNGISSTGAAATSKPQIINNKIEYNGLSGISLAASSTAAVVEGNCIGNNSQITSSPEILVAGTNCTVGQNTITMGYNLTAATASTVDISDTGTGNVISKPLNATRIGTASLTLTKNTAYIYTGSDTTWTLPDSAYSNASNLPTAPTRGLAKGDRITIKHIGTGTLTLAAGGSDMIFSTSSVSSITLASGDYREVFYTGLEWAVE